MTGHDDQNPTYAAGWYPDVNLPGDERWYDGAGWTEHVRPISAKRPTGGEGVVRSPNPTVSVAESRETKPLGGAKAWYKRKGIIIPVAIVGGLILVSGIGTALGGSRPDQTIAQPATEQPSDAGTGAKEAVEPVQAEVDMVDVPNVVGMTEADARSSLSALGFKVGTAGGDPSMPVAAQDVTAGARAEEGALITLTFQEKPKLTIGQSNALRSAEQYLNVMAFSRAGLIQQLTSEYGEGYAPEDAEFAISSLEQAGKVDWNAEAAESARSYLDSMSFSRDGLFQQLTSDYGAGFTPEQANAGLAAVGY